MEKEPRPKKIYDKKAAKPRIEYYCAYQERSQQEVRDKLYNMGLHQKEVEELISELIEGNFLNEERFAISYAGGKFRMKQWGKYKIKQALKIKRVSDYCIKKALQSIPFDDYLAAIDLVILKKSKAIKEKDSFKRQHKLVQYAVSRGFESDLVQERVKTIL
jgi:regulatory protein